MIEQALAAGERLNAHQASLKLLVLDSAFSFDAIRKRRLEESVTCRDLDGFFEHVWTVHPFATLVSEDPAIPKYGHPETHTMSAAHTFIDGKVGRFPSLHRLAGLNFIAGQIALLCSLARLVRKHRITVIRAGDPLYLGLMGWVLARVCRVPLVVRVGGNHDKLFAATGKPLMPRLLPSRRIEKMIERFVFSRADLIAGANVDNLEFALANGAPRERSTLFRYGNLISRMHLADPADRDDARPLLEEIGVEPYRFLLYVGRLEPIKRPEDVVRVLAELVKRGHPLKAILCGDGRLRAELGTLVSTLGVADRVIFAGNRPQPWLARVIPAAAVVLSPHTGRALSEAALGAAPIVAYDVDWQSELISSGETGELVPFAEWMQMADAAERLVQDRARARALGHAVRARALEMLDPDALNQHERDQYTLLLARFHRRGDR